MLLGPLQENLITLLAFDDTKAPVIRNTIELSLYGGQYRAIAAACYDYIDRYKKPPKEHIADILNDKLNSNNKSEADLYNDIVNSIYDAHKTINSEYVMSQLGTFTRRQALRAVAVDLTKALNRDTDASLDEAETLIRKAQTRSLDLFDPGTRLSDKSKSMEFLDEQNESFPTGIAELDRRGFGPTRKEMWLLVANTKGGKTWALIHLAKMALVHHLKVLHITLEMSERRAAQRYFQALFSISKRKEKFKTTSFEKDELGRISGFKEMVLTPAMSLDDPRAWSKLAKRVDKWSERMLKNIYIKQFPTGQLTINQLIAYMDNLEQTERFVPDLLVIDYPDLMKQDAHNYRISLDETYKGIRGIAVARNIAVAAVSQSHRDAAGAKRVDVKNVSEHYGKIFHADTNITMSQTEAEKQLGLARLYVGAGRNDADGLTIVIAQNYGTGNFVVDSVVMRGNYFGLLPSEEEQ